MRMIVLNDYEYQLSPRYKAIKCAGSGWKIFDERKNIEIPSIAGSGPQICSDPYDAREFLIDNFYLELVEAEDTKLDRESMRRYYQRMEIPDCKIALEENKNSKISGFPFFLRKKDNESIQVILLHDYPRCEHLTVYLPNDSPVADLSQSIIITDSLMENFMEQGFEWFHHSEMATLW